MSRYIVIPSIIANRRLLSRPAIARGSASEEVKGREKAIPSRRAEVRIHLEAGPPEGIGGQQ